jgi:hypothetical protein
MKPKFSKRQFCQFFFLSHALLWSSAYLLSHTQNHSILEYYRFFARNPMILNAFLLFPTYRTFRNN